MSLQDSVHPIVINIYVLSCVYVAYIMLPDVIQPMHSHFLRSDMGGALNTPFLFRRHVHIQSQTNVACTNHTLLTHAST